MHTHIRFKRDWIFQPIFFWDMTKGFNLIFVDSFFSARILHCTIVALSAYLFHSPFVFLSYLSVFHTSLGPVNFTKIPHLGIPSLHAQQEKQDNRQNTVATVCICDFLACLQETSAGRCLYCTLPWEATLQPESGFKSTCPEGIVKEKQDWRIHCGQN